MTEPRTFRRVLITGIGGSGGSYLADHIRDHHPDVEVHGLARWHSTTQDNLRHRQGEITVHEADLCDFPSTFAAIQAAQPDAIFHLAAHANVRASFTTPLSVMNNNVMGTATLFEAIRISGLDPWVQLCSTSEVYGQVTRDDVPIREDCAMRPASPYAVSKTTQDMLGRTYFVAYDMKVVTTRMFTYLNPRRTDLFATAWARQVARIEEGLQSELLHGNLESVRTIIDVRDAMGAYWTALEKCAAGEAYNIGGTTTMKVGEFLERLKSMARCEIPHRVDPALLRPADVTLQIPDTTKFVEATGWAPQCSFDDSVGYLLDFWREKARRERALGELVDA